VDDEEILAVIPLEGGKAEGERSGVIAVRPADRMAADIAKVLDLISVRLELESPHPSTAKRVRGARTVPREFVLSMLAAAERRPDMPSLARFKTTRARDVLQSGDAIRLLSERTAMFLASLNYTYEARWAEVVADALATFAIASIAAKDPDQSELAAEVENLRKQLGRKGTKKKKEKKADDKNEE